ncbi:hypothetical protein JCM8202_005620 [Rhodotorula sphaerocarpa]
MVKAKTPAEPAAAPAARKRPAAASEIDDIFAKKPKPAATAAAASPAQGQATRSKKTAKTPKANATTAAKADAAASEPAAASAPSKRVPETVVDTSKSIEGYKPAPMEQTTLKENATEEERKAFEEEERFRDSRGTRTKTEDGLPIYSTSELKIGLGGDTPLCPFDCECCF